jgi:peptidoglycan/LPS O-acetylase OafA/YrhL
LRSDGKLEDSSAAPPAGALARNHGIDRLRGLAILLVVIHHLELRVRLEHTALAAWVPGRLLSALGHNGYESVFVFFVISGFLIAGNALSRWGSLDRIDARAFYGRRFARIVPCLLALVAVLSVLHLLAVHDYTITHANQSLPRAVLAALGLHLNWYEGQTGWLPGGWDVLWSLSIEEVFYLAFPLICLGVRRDWMLLPALVLLSLSLPFTHAALAGNEIWQEKAYLPGMAAIATGVLGALLARTRPIRSRPGARMSWLCGLAGLVAVLLCEKWLWAVLRDGTLLVLTLSTLLVLLACHAKPPRALRGLGWLESWGRLSYEIYLSHMFVVFAVVRLYRFAGARADLGYLWYVPTVAACWLLGELIARGLSQPSDRWLRARLLRPARAEAPALGGASTGR